MDLGFEEKATTEKIKKKRKSKAVISKEFINEDLDQDDEDDTKADVDYKIDEDMESMDAQSKQRESQVKRVTRNEDKKLKKHTKIHEDMEIMGEIRQLLRLGMKNKARTVSVCRLIVIAKTVEARHMLLDIVAKGETCCIKLLLDYKFLKLCHNYWMSDINLKTSISELKLAIKLLDVFELFEIKNKTIVRESKVLALVEKLSNLDLEEKKKLTKDEKKKLKAEKLKREKQLQADNSLENVDAADNKDLSVENMVMDEITVLKKTLKEKATAFFEKWNVLKEDVKIPKKQKLEVMKQHEKEADLHYQNEKELDRRDAYER